MRPSLENPSLEHALEVDPRFIADQVQKGAINAS